MSEPTDKLVRYNPEVYWPSEGQLAACMVPASDGVCVMLSEVQSADTDKDKRIAKLEAELDEYKRALTLAGRVALKMVGEIQELVTPKGQDK